MEEAQLPCAVDREVFERVWRRVMPEPRPDCPIEWEEAPQVALPVPSPLPAAPAPVACCLGPESAVHGAALQGCIDRFVCAQRRYRTLARRGGPSARALQALAAEEERNVRKLATAYFLISGVRYLPKPHPPAPTGPLAGELRWCFGQAQERRAALYAHGAETNDPCLRDLFQELARAEGRHADKIREILEGL